MKQKKQLFILFIPSQKSCKLGLFSENGHLYHLFSLLNIVFISKKGLSVCVCVCVYVCIKISFVISRMYFSSIIAIFGKNYDFIHKMTENDFSCRKFLFFFFFARKIADFCCIVATSLAIFLSCKIVHLFPHEWQSLCKTAPLSLLNTLSCKCKNCPL